TFVNTHISGFTIDADVPLSSSRETTANQAIAPTQLLTSGATHTFDAAKLLSSTGTPFPPTEVTPLSIQDTVIVTPAKMEPYIVAGANLVIDSGKPNQETVTVLSVTPTTFTATFVNPHNNPPLGFTIGDASNPSSETTTASQALTGTQPFS